MAHWMIWNNVFNKGFDHWFCFCSEHHANQVDMCPTLFFTGIGFLEIIKCLWVMSITYGPEKKTLYTCIVYITIPKNCYVISI